MNHLGKYSNSWGHLIVSLVCIISGVILILFSQDSTARGLGSFLITTVTAFWFVTGARSSMLEHIPPGNDTDNK